MLILSKSLPSQKTQTGLRLMKVCLHAKVVKLGYPKENSLFHWLGVLPSLFKDPGHTWDPVVSPQWLWSSSFQPPFFSFSVLWREVYFSKKSWSALWLVILSVFISTILAQMNRFCFSYQAPKSINSIQNNWNKHVVLKYSFCEAEDKETKRWIVEARKEEIALTECLHTV